MRITVIGLVASLGIAGKMHAAPAPPVVWEAEHPSSIHRPLFRIETKRSFPHQISGDGYVQMPWNKHHRAGHGTYRFKVPYAGMYYVWLRTQWQNPFSNRVYVAVNGGRPQSLGEDATYQSWHWVGGRARVRCRAGWNTLVLQELDMGVKIDQILVTSDSNLIPAGIR
ncbi:hypothetical protein EON80_13735 [bacterium]|nr:MAG: hypothetical protein EON80_13735 [bacterium]